MKSLLLFIFTITFINTTTVCFGQIGDKVSSPYVTFRVCKELESYQADKPGIWNDVNNIISIQEKGFTIGGKTFETSEWIRDKDDWTSCNGEITYVFNRRFFFLKIVKPNVTIIYYHSNDDCEIKRGLKGTTKGTTDIQQGEVETFVMFLGLPYFVRKQGKFWVYTSIGVPQNIFYQED